MAVPAGSAPLVAVIAAAGSASNRPARHRERGLTPAAVAEEGFGPWGSTSSLDRRQTVAAKPARQSDHPPRSRACPLKHGATGVVDGLVEQLFATENDCLTTKQLNPGLAEHAVATGLHVGPLQP